MATEIKKKLKINCLLNSNKIVKKNKGAFFLKQIASLRGVFG